MVASLNFLRRCLTLFRSGECSAACLDRYQGNPISVSHFGLHINITWGPGHFEKVRKNNWLRLQFEVMLVDKICNPGISGSIQQLRMSSTECHVYILVDLAYMIVHLSCPSAKNRWVIPMWLSYTCFRVETMLLWMGTRLRFVGFSTDLSFFHSAQNLMLSQTKPRHRSNHVEAFRFPIFAWIILPDNRVSPKSIGDISHCCCFWLHPIQDTSRYIPHEKSSMIEPSLPNKAYLWCVTIPVCDM